MNLKDLHRTIPAANPFSVAKLKGHAVDFTLNSYTRKGGVADIAEHESATVHGILWEVSDFKTLDEREGAPWVYERFSLMVELDTGEEVEAQTYRVLRKEPPVRPSDKYLSLFLKPALVLPETYLKGLQDYAGTLPVQSGSYSGMFIDAL